MTDSIFTKIIRGEIPCHKIYEDDLTFAFLDIHPVQSGHTLIVSKKQVEQLWDLPDDHYRAVMAAAKKVAKRLKEVIGKEYVGVVVKGIDVPHAHVHLIPFNRGERLKADDPPTGEADHATLAAMAKRLAF